MTSIDDILDNFSFLEDWEDRYRYVVELGRELEAFPDEARTEANKVKGCVSQVWVTSRSEPGEAGPILHFVGDSDAHIVRGLVAIALALFSDRPAKDILTTDAEAVFSQIGLKENLTPQRANGLTALIARIRRDAEEALIRPGIAGGPNS